MELLLELKSPMASGSEKSYSVVAEMEDGQTRTVLVRGASPGEAFRQVKAMPGVRRVGKVAEGEAAARQAGHGRSAPPPHRPLGPQPGSGPESAMPVSREALVGHAISGPRVVQHARLAGAEQPFKNLQARPEWPQYVERPKPPPEPPRKPDVTPAATAVTNEPAAPTAPSPEPAPRAEAPAAPGRDYRVLKSRRQDGEPYLLQRGHWEQTGGKRVFAVEWEKGFPARESALAHQEWLQRTEREMAETADADHEAA